MIDTPQNCFDRALVSRADAEGTMLETVRNKHLASASAWESLGRLLQGAAREREVRPPVPKPARLPAAASARPRLSIFDGWENEGGSLHARA